MRYLSLSKFLTLSSLTTTTPDNEGAVTINSHKNTDHASQKARTLQKGIEATENQNRRRALQNIGMAFTTAGATISSTKSNALDMDAFINKELEADTKNCDPKRDPKCKPKLTDDEALCKYGQSGEARGEACKRVKEAGGELPKSNTQGRSLGGAYAM